MLVFHWDCYKILTAVVLHYAGIQICLLFSIDMEADQSIPLRMVNYMNRPQFETGKRPYSYRKNRKT